MTVGSSAIPVGMLGLRYPITQISLAVRDLDRTMECFYRAFGWGPWNVFEHRLPVHHSTELRGQSTHYALRGAEVYVGDMNFELLEPTEGPNLWSEFIAERGEGIASIAVMFKEKEDGDAVKAAFRRRYGIDVTMKANIGDHIEYYYLDTQERFGCLIESGSGHAIDFVEPAYVFPGPNTPPPTMPPLLGYRISQVSLVVRDLDAKLNAYHGAFGWGPWRIFQSDGQELMHDCEFRGHKADFNIRWAETMVGNVNFELIQPLGGQSPFQEHLDAKGEGIVSIAVMFKTREESEKVKAQFAELGIRVLAVGHIGKHIEWYYLDTEPTFKCLIESGSGHAIDFATPFTIYP